MRFNRHCTKKVEKMTQTNETLNNDPLNEWIQSIKESIGKQEIELIKLKTTLKTLESYKKGDYTQKGY
jgi:hypothetical protein